MFRLVLISISSIRTLHSYIHTCTRISNIFDPFDERDECVAVTATAAAVDEAYMPIPIGSIARAKALVREVQSREGCDKSEKRTRIIHSQALHQIFRISV